MVTGRCRPFSLPVLAFNFYRAWGSAIPLLVDLSSSTVEAPGYSSRCRVAFAPDKPPLLAACTKKGMQYISTLSVLHALPVDVWS